jgi:hypothetical protein
MFRRIAILSIAGACVAGFSRIRTTGPICKSGVLLNSSLDKEHKVHIHLLWPLIGEPLATIRR